MTFDTLRRRTTERDPLIDRHIIADFGCLTDNNTHAVVDKKTPADFGARMDLDARKKAAHVAHETRQGSELALPYPVCQPVQQDRMKSRISKRDFPHRPQRRVTLGNNLDIFFNILPHAEKLALECWSIGVLGQITLPITPLLHYSTIPAL